MTNSKLTLDNFSFIRKPILEPPFEIVRSSGSVGRGQFGSPKTLKQNQESQPQVVIERDGEEKVLSESSQLRGRQVWQLFTVVTISSCFTQLIETRGSSGLFLSPGISLSIFCMQTFLVFNFNTK